ncbi:MAG: response regulator [Chitinivibrionales bacterium]|nr:response regulator [Chitinivibrionales bacterium]
MPTKNKAQNAFTVYIVDDDPSVRRGLSRLMKSAGLAARTFGSASEFLMLGMVKSPGCLILDIRMPGMDGPQLQEKLKTEGSTMPIIFITATASHDENTRVRLMAGGALAYFVKPFDGELLLQGVREAFDIVLKDSAGRVQA